MRNRKIYTVLLLLFYCIISIICFARKMDSMDKASLVLRPVQGQVYTVTGGLGNVAVLYDSAHILLVDTKIDSAAMKMKQVFAQQLPGRRIKYIINTHMHFDHTGGNTLLGSEAVIIGQRNAKQYKHDKPVEWPTLTFDSTLTIYFNGEEVQLIHYPHSHTDHDVVVYFKNSKVLSMGDMYFSGIFPFVTSQGSIKGLIANLGSIIDMLPEDVKIIPGHGPVSTLSDLRATRNMLIETAAFVEKQAKAGKSLEQIKKEGLPKEWAAWADGYCRQDCWIEELYEFMGK